MLYPLLLPVLLIAGQDSAERRVIPARPQAADTLEYSTTQTNLLVEDAVVQASPRTGMIFFDHRGPHRGTVLRNLKIHVEPGTLPLDRSFWGVRGYDMIDTLLDRVEVTGFGRVTEKHDEGHALYLNLAGSLAVVDCFLHDNGGQGLQIVNRPVESSLPRGPAEGTIMVRKTRFWNNGFNPDRGAFQLSIFGTGQDVRLEHVEFKVDLDPERWPDVRSRGALLIEPEPYAPARKKDPWWRPEEPPEDFEIPFTQGVVQLSAVTFAHPDPDRPIVQIKGCRELYVLDCNFKNSGSGRPLRIELDRPDKPGRNTGRIVWQGNRGNAVVFLRGKELGPASEDFVIE